MDNQGDKSMTVILTNPELLDCYICAERLNGAVFQCENGHIACSSCCRQLEICPTCPKPIGTIRCRAIESMLESLKIECVNKNYGCKRTMSLTQTNVHQRCKYDPCYCPHPECGFVDSTFNLSRHFSTEHKDSAICFDYNQAFRNVSLNVEEKVLIFQSNSNKVLFVLNNCVVKDVGNAITLCRIGPSYYDKPYAYKIMAYTEDRHVATKSFTMSSSTGIVNDILSTEFFLVPFHFVDASGQMKLEMCIISE